MIIDSILEQIIQGIADAVWKRPELERLREPIEQALQANSFKQLTRQALSELESRCKASLPNFLTDTFIENPVTQRHLAAYIVLDRADAVGELAALYTRQFGGDASSIEADLKGYLKTLRESLATHSTYGPILLARDIQAMTAALNNLRVEMHERFDQIFTLLNRLFSEPEFRALVEQRTGKHIFLSYSRKDSVSAIKIRNALQAAGHRVWQDVTSLVGGQDWQKSIVDGIKRAYAMVLVVSQASNESYWVNEEFLYARESGKPIVPIMVENCEILFGRKGLQTIVGYPEIESGFSSLIASLPPLEQVQNDEPEILDRRKLEEMYLAEIELTYRVWQTVYTPMGGVGQMQTENELGENIEITKTGIAMESLFDAFWKEEAKREKKTNKLRHNQYEDVLEAVRDMRQLVILGDPGSGKSTSLWRIASDLSLKAKEDTKAPLPVVIRLGELGTYQDFEDAVQKVLGDLAPFYSDLLKEKRLAFLLDGLNEMPSDRNSSFAQAIKNLAEDCRNANLLLVITCRRLDYVGELDMGIAEQVEIAPLDPIRIHRFINSYIVKPEGKGDEFFWALAGRKAYNTWKKFTRELSLSGRRAEITFWLEPALGKNIEWGYANKTWKQWLKERESPRSLLSLASNPFILFMITQVFTHEKNLPQNRSALFERFINFLLAKREKLSKNHQDSLKNALADLSFELQKDGEGTAFTEFRVLRYLTPTQLYQAKSANILSGSEHIRFSHQLLQEYFAAKRLDREMQAEKPVSSFLIKDIWWKPQGWDETLILLTGLYSEDTTPVIEWLKDIQPEVTARCILESGAMTPQKTIQALRGSWLPRVVDENESPHSRVALGRALAMLNLDNRKGIGLLDNGLPDILWGTLVEGGDYQIAEDREAYQPLLADKIKFDYGFWVSAYPVTAKQFEAFLEDKETGFHKDAWWDGFPEKYKKQPMLPQKFQYTNHPRDSISWYQAVAFCRWLTAKYHACGNLAEDFEIRLPTEHEWEIVARYPGNKAYSFGNKIDISKLNILPTGIGMTNAVGIFPSSTNELGICDLNGNVREWCLTDYESGSNTINETAKHLQGKGAIMRVLRGGSYADKVHVVRSASRIGYFPFYADNKYGFRLCKAPKGHFD